MIRYALKCSNDHSFESWFQSAEGFDTLQAAGHVGCPTCGDTDVKKALMAPKVTPARKATSQPAPTLRSEETPQEAAFAKMRDHIEKNSDYVGKNFAHEARAMHDGDVPDRPIHGEASLADAKSLVDDGVPVLPLPFTPKQQQN
ncbi:DUF1178 family protein [Shimia ponticola]|uniref:DUF1178 family protein n=1 Tax=Shimia ponticola TaxID=2582893 RepID=UPI0011BEAB06|nr:DUF1178 family protein [Shimia ponticola]